MTGGKASEFRGRGLASGAWMGGRVRGRLGESESYSESEMEGAEGGRLKGHGVGSTWMGLVRSGVNPGESESSISYYWHTPTFRVRMIFRDNRVWSLPIFNHDCYAFLSGISNYFCCTSDLNSCSNVWCFHLIVPLRMVISHSNPRGPGEVSWIG